MTLLAKTLTVLVIGSCLSFEFKTAQDKSYRYGFQVTNKDEGNEFSHQQDVKHGQTSGEYRIHLPDGRWQIVSYIADDRGYRAIVRYEEPNNPLGGGAPPATWGFNPRDRPPSPSPPRPTPEDPYPGHKQAYDADPEQEKYGPTTRTRPYSQPDKQATLTDRSPTGDPRPYTTAYAEHPGPKPELVDKDPSLYTVNDRKETSPYSGHRRPYYEQPSLRGEPHRDPQLGRPLLLDREPPVGKLPPREMENHVGKSPLHESYHKNKQRAEVLERPDALPKSRWRFPDEEPSYAAIPPQVNTFVIHPTPPTVRPLRLFPLEPFLEPNVEHWQPLNPLLTFALEDNADLEQPKNHNRPGGPPLNKGPPSPPKQELEDAQIKQTPEVHGGRYGPERVYPSRVQVEQEEDRYRRPEPADKTHPEKPSVLPPRSQSPSQALPPKQRPPMYGDGVRLLYGIVQSAHSSAGPVSKIPKVPSSQETIRNEPLDPVNDPVPQAPPGLSQGRLSHLHPVFVPPPPEFPVDLSTQMLKNPNLFEGDNTDHQPPYQEFPRPQYFSVSEKPNVWLKPHGDTRYKPTGYKPRPHHYHENALNSTSHDALAPRPGGLRPAYDFQPYRPGFVNPVPPNVYTAHKGSAYPTVFQPTPSVIDPNLEGEAPTELPSNQEVPSEDPFEEYNKKYAGMNSSSKPFALVPHGVEPVHSYPSSATLKDHPSLQHGVESGENLRYKETNPPSEVKSPVVNPTSVPPLDVASKLPETRPQIRPTTRPLLGPVRKPSPLKPIKQYSSGTSANKENPTQPVTEKPIDLLQLYPFPGSGLKGGGRPGQRISKIPTTSSSPYASTDEIQKAHEPEANHPEETSDPVVKPSTRPGHRFQMRKKPKINFKPKGPFPSPGPRPKFSNITEEGSLLAKYPLRPKRPNFTGYGHRVQPLKRLNEQTGRIADVIDLRSFDFEARPRKPVEDSQAIVFPDSEEFVEGLAPILKPQEVVDDDDLLEGEPPLESETSELAGRIPSTRPKVEATSSPVFDNAAEFLFEIPGPLPPPPVENTSQETTTEIPVDIISFSDIAPSVLPESEVQNEVTTPEPTVQAVTTSEPETALFTEDPTTETPTTTEAPSTTTTTATTTTTRRSSFVPRFRTTTTTTTPAPSSAGSTRRNRVTFKPRNRTRLPAPVSRKIPNVVVLEPRDEENRAENRTGRAFKFPPRIRFLQKSERVTREYQPNSDFLNQTDFSTVADESTDHADDAPGKIISHENENELGERAQDGSRNIPVLHESLEKSQPAMLRLQPFELFLLPPSVTESVGTSNVRYPAETAGHLESV